MTIFTIDYPTDVTRLRGVQNMTTGNPSRRNGREWWYQVYSDLRKKKYQLKHTNTPSASWIFTENRDAVVYGPCGKLP